MIPLKKAELNEFYIESLLLEIETDELKLINQFFNLVDNEVNSLLLKDIFKFIAHLNLRNKNWLND